MGRAPHYPDEASVGSAQPAGEAVAAASAAREAAGGGRRNKHLVTGAAIGIGSAAIVAALLYANRRARGHSSNG